MDRIRYSLCVCVRKILMYNSRSKYENPPMVALTHGRIQTKFLRLNAASCFNCTWAHFETNVTRGWSSKILYIGYRFQVFRISTLTLGLRSKKPPTFTELGTHCTHIFKIIFSTFLSSFFFRFMVPCITYQYLINQHDAAGQWPLLLHFLTTLHVSGATCTHHQEYNYIYAASGTSTHRMTAFLRGRVYILPRREAVIRCVLVPEAAYTVVVLLMMGASSTRNM